MRTKRIEVAKSVASRLHAAEEAIDIAATRVAEFIAIMPMARLDAKLSAMIGQDAFTSGTGALALMAQVREQIVITHERLKSASDEIGLETVSWGDVIKPNAGYATSAAVGQLRIAS